MPGGKRSIVGNFFSATDQHVFLVLRCLRRWSCSLSSKSILAMDTVVFWIREPTFWSNTKTSLGKRMCCRHRTTTHTRSHPRLMRHDRRRRCSVNVIPKSGNTFIRKWVLQQRSWLPHPSLGLSWDPGSVGYENNVSQQLQTISCHEMEYRRRHGISSDAS